MTDSTRASRRASSILFIGVSLLVSALILAAVEGALRLVGVGAPPALHVSRLGYQQVELPILVPDERPDGTPILRTRDRRLPYQAIRRNKRSRGLRIFVFGGSAAAGLGFSPNVSFSRYLERMVLAAHPSAELEVVNLGIVALSSSEVREIARDVCERYEPDVLVVYSGNNEFLELHARKYMQLHASPAEKAREALSETHLYRLVSQAVRRRSPRPDFDNRDLASSNVKMTQDEIIQDIDVTPDEVRLVVDRYEQNLEQIARTAQAQDVPLLLLSVASNWEWRGREDLPERYLAGIVPDEDLEPKSRALDVLGARLKKAPTSERWDLLFRRATLLREMGRVEEARDDYRASMNADPHLRRALDAMARRVSDVAARHDAHFVDTIEILAANAEDGIVGFDQFYDYVHFTPKGALQLAAALYEELARRELLPEAARDFATDEYVQAELARIASLRRDDYDVGTWLGIGFDRSNLADRNLWKYDEMAERLDERIERDADDVAALVYRGNVHYDRVDGAQASAADYRAALEFSPDDAVIRSNLDRLLENRAAD